MGPLWLWLWHLRLSKRGSRITPRHGNRGQTSSHPRVLPRARFGRRAGFFTHLLAIAPQFSGDTKDPSRLRLKSTRHQGRSVTNRGRRPSRALRNMAWRGQHAPVKADSRLRFTTHLPVATNSRCRMRPPVSRGCPQPATRAKRCKELHGNTDLSHKGIDMLERLQLYRLEHA